MRKTVFGWLAIAVLGVSVLSGCGLDLFDWGTDRAPRGVRLSSGYDDPYGSSCSGTSWGGEGYWNDDEYYWDDDEYYWDDDEYYWGDDEYYWDDDEYYDDWDDWDDDWGDDDWDDWGDDWDDW